MLIYGAIHEQIGNFLDELNIKRSRRHIQVNEHKFKAGNCVRIHGQGGVNGYCVRGATPKYMFYVCKIDIFKHRPTIYKMGNDDGVMHAHPYYGDFVETVQNWCT